MALGCMDVLQMARVVMTDARALDIRYDELAALAKGKRCAKCKRRPAVAWLDGEYRLRCDCFPNPPTLVRLSPEKEKIGDMVQSITKIDPTGALTVQEIVRYLAPAATEKEAQVFRLFCETERLNPFAGEAYLIPFNDRKAGVVKHVIVVGINAYARRASENPIFAGMRSGVLVMRNDALQRREGTFTLPGDELVGGWVEIYGKGWAVPYVHTVKLTDWDKGVSVWLQKGGKETMIKKVAESQGLRRAIPKVNISYRPDAVAVYEGEEASPAPIPAVISNISGPGGRTLPEPTTSTQTGSGIPFNGICPDHNAAFVLRDGIAKGKPYKFWACPNKDDKGEYCKRKPVEWLVAQLQTIAPQLVDPPRTSKNIAEYLVAESWGALERIGMAAILEEIKATVQAKAPAAEGVQPPTEGPQEGAEAF